MPRLQIPSILCDCTEVSGPKRNRLIASWGQKSPLGQMQWEGILGRHSLDHVFTLVGRPIRTPWNESFRKNRTNKIK